MSKHTGKPNRHEKVAVVLLSGKPVTPDEIRTVFDGTDQEKVLYRLSTNIYNIRRDGGVVRVHKSGRKVTAYQLMNPDDFDSNGRYNKKVQPQAVKPAPFDIAEDGTSKSGENYLTVQYEKLTALLIEGMKEQQILIDDLTARVVLLESIIKA